MKFLLSFLPVLALAAHDHHEHKRDYVTVVVTQMVTQGLSSQVGAAVQQSTTLSSVPTTTLSAVLSGSSFSTVYYSSNTVASADTSVATTASSSQSTSTASSSTSAVSGVNGKGITYSPYSDTGSCKSSSEIASDMAILSDYELIRLYDTDCDAISAILSSKQSSQKLFLGIFYLAKIQSSVDIIAAAVTNWDEIYTISVGNELVNNGEATTDEIKSAIETTRTALTAVGYTGPVVSVDTLVAVQNNPALCEYSDYIAVNSHPFWDGNVAPADSGSFLQTGIANMKSLCNKDVLITETGWPTQGNDYLNCVPSAANQKTALESIGSAVADSVLLFTTYNDLWKSPGSYGVEQYWGIYSSS